MLGGHYERAVGLDIDSAFRRFDGFKTADIAMVNLETPVTLRGAAKKEKPWSFRMKPDGLAALPRAGIRLVNLANNHIYDSGRQGLFDTISYLDSIGIAHVGAGRSRREAFRPAVVTVRGVKIGFQGYYSGLEAPAARDSVAGVTRRTMQGIADDIRALRTVDSVRYIVVSLHWGHENADTPATDQIAFAHAIINAGADAVIGHHSHVVQGIEKYKSGVIAYSLGNLIFGGNHHHTYDSGLFEIALGGQEPEYTFIPVRVKRWNARLLNGHEAAAVTARVQQRSSQFTHSIFTRKESR